MIAIMNIFITTIITIINIIMITIIMIKTITINVIKIIVITTVTSTTTEMERRHLDTSRPDLTCTSGRGPAAPAPPLRARRS